jgi:hypothetical protein
MNRMVASCVDRWGEMISAYFAYNCRGHYADMKAKMKSIMVK